MPPDQPCYDGRKSVDVDEEARLRAYFAETSFDAPSTGLPAFCETRTQALVTCANRKSNANPVTHLFLSSNGSLGLLLLFVRQHRHGGANLPNISVIERGSCLLGDLDREFVVQRLGVQSLEEDGRDLSGEGLPFGLGLGVGLEQGVDVDVVWRKG